MKADFTKKEKKTDLTIRKIVERHREMDAREHGAGLIERERQCIDTLREKVKKIKEWLKENEDKAGSSGKPLKSTINDNESAKMKRKVGTIESRLIYNRRVGTVGPEFANIN